MPGQEPRWTIEELTTHVGTTLAAAPDYQGPRSGQVRAVPDLRSIRYYTTLGLIDRPAELRGRTAYYGPRHLRQLVAIKRLQERGLSLAHIQAELAGITDAALASLAALPGSPAPTADPSPARGPAPRRSERFWGATAASPSPPAPPPPPAPSASTPPALTPSAPDPPLLAGLPLGDGVTLLLPADRPLGDADRRALVAAAAPLLDQLRARGLLPRHDQKGE